jgi:hypothetical protein
VRLLVSSLEKERCLIVYWRWIVDDAGKGGTARGGGKSQRVSLVLWASLRRRRARRALERPYSVFVYREKWG